MKKFFLFFAALALLACNSSGPRATLETLARAMEANNAQEFISQFDMDAYANNEIRSMMENDQALNAINSFGRMLGLGSVDDLIASIVDVKRELDSRFTRQIASGELMAQCRVATTPDCPWVPEALRSAEIVEVGIDGAIARVTTPARLTSWICLRKISGKWQVVGRTVLESEARALVSAPAQAPAAPASGNNGKNINI